MKDAPPASASETFGLSRSLRAQSPGTGLLDLHQTPYRTTHLLGEGAFGRVYAGVHEALGKRVAIKTLQPEDVHDAARVRRFTQEARALAEVDHPHVVEVSHLGEDALGAPFFVMPLLDGVPLDQRLKAQGALPWTEAVRITREILEGLRAAHAKGVVHRDVKPANVLLVDYVGSPGSVKLIDFGIAHKLEAGTSAIPARIIQELGTPAYLAPEQARVARQDHRVDIYAVGVVLYELLTGRIPFEDADLHRVLLMHQHDAAPPLDVPGLPAGLEAVIHKAMAKAPVDRFDGCDAFLTALEVVDGPPAPALPLAGSPSPAHARARISAPTMSVPTELERLARVVQRQWVDGVLAAELGSHRATLQPPARLRFDLVSTPWRDFVGLLPDDDGVIPADRSPATVFEDLHGMVLVTGAGGSGKSIWLLQLLSALLDQRADGPSAVPVLFKLADWSVADADARAFMRRQLHERYLIALHVADAWIGDGLIVPLFDGLDEVPPARRAACAAALNDLLTSRQCVAAAVACRFAEYQFLDRRLPLNGAVQLDPLSADQVQDHLGDPAWLRLLDAQPAASPFARTPLSLRVLGEIGDDVTTWPTEAEPDTIRRYAFRRYATRLLARPGKRRTRSEATVLAAIRWLASRMEDDGAVLFDPLSLQPTWLRTGASRWRYGLWAASFPAALLGASIVLPMALTPEDNQGFDSTLAFGAALGVGLTLAFTAVGLAHAAQEARGRQLASAWARVGLVLATAPAVGIPVGIATSGTLHPYPMEAASILALLFGLALGHARRPPPIHRPAVIRLHPSRLRQMAPALFGVAVGTGILSTMHPTSILVPLFGSGLVLALVVLGLYTNPVVVEEPPERPPVASAWLAPALAATAIAFLGCWAAFSLSQPVGFSALGALPLALLAGTALGFADHARHVALRRALRHPDELGMDVVEVLEAAADAALMRRVGHAYLFVHRGLQQGLAEDADDPQSVKDR